MMDEQIKWQSNGYDGSDGADGNCRKCKSVLYVVFGTGRNA